MEEMVQNFLNLGVVGVVAYVSFKTILDEKKEDRAMYKDSIDKFDSKLDRFADAIENNNDRLGAIEEDVMTIKEKVGV